jgi:hypothetical protein
MHQLLTIDIIVDFWCRGPMQIELPSGLLPAHILRSRYDAITIYHWLRINSSRS